MKSKRNREFGKVLTLVILFPTLILSLSIGCVSAENLDAAYSSVFTDVASEYGVNDSRRGIGISWFDYDNDGDLDICNYSRFRSQ